MFSMKCKCLILIFLIVTGLMLSGCIESDEDIDEDQDSALFIPKPVNVASIPDYIDLVLDNIASGVKIPPIPARKSMPGFCYLESYSMMLGYLDESINISEVFATAGLGALTFCDTHLENQNLRPMQGYVAYTQIRSMKSYDLKWVVGYAEEGGFSETVEDPYLEDATAKVRYPTEGNMSLTYLKAVLNTGRPIQVHLDLHYLGAYNTKFQNQPPGSSHYIVVTGYNETEIYISETYLSEENTSEFKDMPVPIDVFIDAWYQGGRIHGNNNTPTYWMLFFEQKKYSDVVTKPNFIEVMSVQKNLSKNIEEQLDTYISKTQTGEYDIDDTSWIGLANIKQLFAEYLREKGYDNAADAYQILYEDYGYCQVHPAEAKDKLSEIKEHEITARSLLP